MNRVPCFFIFALVCSLWESRLAAAHEAPGHVHIRTEHAQGRAMKLDSLWLYHPGDDPAWAAPSFPDSAWEVVDSRLFPQDLPGSGWPGVGWFRIHIHPDGDLTDVPFGLQMWQIGATDIYLDGQKIFSFATGDTTSAREAHAHLTELMSLPLEAGRHHVLAVRHVNRASPLLARASYRMGFSARVGGMQAMFEHHTHDVHRGAGLQMFFLGALVVLCLLHFMLFAFNRTAKENLYYAVFTAAVAVVTHMVYQMSPVLRQGELFDMMHWWNVGAIIAPITGVRFVYVLFCDRVPKVFYAIVAAGAALIAWSLFDPAAATRATNYFSLVGLIEFTRVVGVGVAWRKPGAGIITLGAVPLVIGTTQGLFVRMDLVTPTWNVNEIFLMGVGALLLSMSVHLAKNVARTNRDLRKRLVEVRKLSAKMTEEVVQRRLLEAEHVRKTRELEEARALQLAMVPSELPDLPDLDIAVYMKAATEVGGDYYDFHTAEDGTLTVVVGDATGHGAKAGAMVTAAKSLFTALAEEPSLVTMLHRFSEALRSMHLPQIYLALALLRIKDGKVHFTSAGMPPLLIYRAGTGTIEEVLVKGMPLGGPMRFPYVEREVDLNPGDTLLLMSDGLPELFSASGAMLGYDGARMLFQETARRSPQEIIENLTRAGHAWSNGTVQTDDITFVVLHLKTPQEIPTPEPEHPALAEIKS